MGRMGDVGKSESDYSDTYMENGRHRYCWSIHRPTQRCARRIAEYQMKEFKNPFDFEGKNEEGLSSEDKRYMTRNHLWRLPLVSALQKYIETEAWLL